jgi:hypothetical protein
MDDFRLVSIDECGLPPGEEPCGDDIRLASSREPDREPSKDDAISSLILSVFWLMRYVKSRSK